MTTAPEQQPPAPEHDGQPAPGDDHEEAALDEALEETFPSSDPIAVSISTSPLLSRYHRQ